MKALQPRSSSQAALTLSAMALAACGSVVNIGQAKPEGVKETSTPSGIPPFGTETSGTSLPPGTMGSGGTGGTGNGGGETGGSTAGGSSGTAGAGGATGGATTGGNGGVGGASNPGAGGGSGVPIGDSGLDAFTNNGLCGNVIPFARHDSWIAYDAGPQVNDAGGSPRAIFMVHPDGSGRTQLTDGTHIDIEPAFSPDGTLLTFTSDRAGGRQLFLLELATHEIRQFTCRPDGGEQSAFSGDGKLVAFRSGTAIYTIELSGFDFMVVNGADRSNAYFFPTFSADGSEIVFEGSREIDAIRRDGSGFRQVLKAQTSAIKTPRVSPFPRDLILDASDGDASRDRGDASNGDATDARPTDGPEIAYAATCDANGPSIYVSTQSSSADPCQATRVTCGETDHFTFHPSWGSSKVLAYERIDRLTGVATIAITNRDDVSYPACELTQPDMDSRNPSWLP